MFKNRSGKGKKKTKFKRNNIEDSKKPFIHLHTKLKENNERKK